MKYLLDTDICICLIKQKPASVLQKLTTVSNSEVALSAISLYELQSGVAYSQRQAQAQQALDHFIESLENILPIDRSVANTAAKIRADLRSKGTPIGSYDILIAATALANDLILVSNNVNEFDRVEELKLENWVVD